MAKNPWIAFLCNLFPLGFAAVYFGGAINSGIATVLVKIGWRALIFPLFASGAPGGPGWLLLWIGLHFTWGLGYLYLGRWVRWLLTALVGLVITSGVLMFASLFTALGLEGTVALSSTPMTQLLSLGVALFTAAMVLFTSIDARRLLRATAGRAHLGSPTETEAENDLGSL